MLPTGPTQKRTDYIARDNYFMGVALLSAQRSKDATQVGACLVSPDKRIISTGYNGLPNGCSDDIYPREREGSILQQKYTYSVHAEMNALLNTGGRDTRGATAYVTLFPCNICTKLFIQAGIKKIVYLSDKYHDNEEYQASRIMLSDATVEVQEFLSKRKEITLTF